MIISVDCLIKKMIMKNHYKMQKKVFFRNPKSIRSVRMSNATTTVETELGGRKWKISSFPHGWLTAEIRISAMQHYFCRHIDDFPQVVEYALEKARPICLRFDDGDMVLEAIINK